MSVSPLFEDAYEPVTVCPVHLRFVPCRRCKEPGKRPMTSDPFVVEITRRYQAGELNFRLDVDAEEPRSQR